MTVAQVFHLGPLVLRAIPADARPTPPRVFTPNTDRGYYAEYLFNVGIYDPRDVERLWQEERRRRGAAP